MKRERKASYTQQHRNAQLIDGTRVHISDVESGKKEYYCIGCHKEMQACKSKIVNSYFRHDSLYKNNDSPCSYSDEDYILKTALETIQRLKAVKVPPIIGTYKENGTKKYYYIDQAEIIETAEVAINRYIYHNNIGETVVSAEIENPDQPYFNPNSILVNESGRLELMVFFTFKKSIQLDDETMASFNVIGIPAIEIKLNRKIIISDLDSIIKFSTKRTKWLYHGNENTIFIKSIHQLLDGNRIPDSDKGGIHGKENTNCRQIRLSNAIRGVRGFIATTEFQKRKEDFERDIRERSDSYRKRKQTFDKREKSFQGRKVDLKRAEQDLRTAKGEEAELVRQVDSIPVTEQRIKAARDRELQTRDAISRIERKRGRIREKSGHI